MRCPICLIRWIRFPRHHWRGSIEAGRARAAGRHRARRFRAIIGAAPLKPYIGGEISKMQDCCFRAIIGAAPLKLRHLFFMQSVPCCFRAIIGAAPLKHRGRADYQAGRAGFPRHHWRGSIEACRMQTPI